MATQAMPRYRGRTKNKRYGDRGRQAESPKQMTASGWKDTLVRVKGEMKKDRLSLIAAGMAYYMLFSLVPAITAVILIYAWVSDPQQITGQIQQFSNVMPQETQAILTQQLSSLASTAPSALGVSAIGALLFSIWSASKGSKALMDALNIIYDEQENRGFFKYNLTAVGITLLAVVLSLVAIGVIVGTPVVINFFQLGRAFELAVTVASWVVLLGLFSFFLSVAYRYGPFREKARWSWVSWGAVISAVLFVVASALFSWYAGNFGNFNKTYGSLGAIIVLMMWFYISCFVILLGGEVNAELEHQTMKDSTTGREEPLGRRGAQMADNIGKSSQKEAT